MELQDNNPRYRIDTFYAPSLENNAIGDDPNKKVKIYLPPGYFAPENQEKRYPTIYFLNGYGVSLKTPTFNTKHGWKQIMPFITRLMLRKLFKVHLTYEHLDTLISRNEMKPFILIQPDGDLPLPNYFKVKNSIGDLYNKGCFFMNSPYTGNYEDYVFKDLIEYLDANFHTIGKKSSRALTGISMGGFGAVLGGIKHPDKFNAIAPISPLINLKDTLDVKAIPPMVEKILGREKAELEFQKDLIDTIDTADMILYKERELIEKDKLKADIKSKLDGMDLNLVLNQFPNAFENVNLAFYCEENDEWEFPSQIRAFEQSLKNKNIPCTIDIFTSKFAQKYSSHQMGISFRLKEIMNFCLDNLV
jgi:hypothetical protein